MTSEKYYKMGGFFQVSDLFLEWTNLNNRSKNVIGK